MVDLYLVTGFLGAGKTTFLKNLLRVLAPRKIRVIVNEFGKAGVDGALLAEMEATLEEISGGSIFCVCRMDQFEKALETALADPPDALVIEASGLSDPVGVRKLLEDERFKSFAYRGAVCLVDAERFEKVFATARACARQLSVSGLVLINKTDLAGEEKASKVAAIIRERYPEANIKTTSHGKLDPAWLDEMDGGNGGDAPEPQRDLTLQSMAITVKDAMSPDQLEHFIRQFVEDTYRVKGFVRLEGGTYLADCVGSYVKVTPWDGGQPENIGVIVALAGKGMPLRQSIKRAAALYSAYVNFLQ